MKAFHSACYNKAASKAAPPSQQEGIRKVWPVLKDYLSLSLGVMIVALGIHFFKFPNHFAMGGVAGIAVVLSKLIPALTPAGAAFIINILLLVVAYLTFGRHFAIRTTYATLLLSILQLALERFLPIYAPLTEDTLLELFFAIICSSIGSALLFNQRASTGGTDIIAMIVRSHSSLNIGKALLVTDLLIGASTFFIFDIRTGLYSVCGILMKGVIVDSLIESFNRVKYFTIICNEPESIAAYITQELKRGCTRMEGEGVFSHGSRAVLLCVVSRMQAVQLKRFIRENDPGAFMMITNTSEIIGHGFRSTD